MLGRRASGLVFVLWGGFAGFAASFAGEIFGEIKRSGSGVLVCCQKTSRIKAHTVNG